MKFASALLLLSASALTFADVRLPALISDHMVLQRDRPARIWGWADENESVTVKFRGQAITTQANELGKWHVFLQPTAGGGPFTLSIEGKNAITINDVLVGEVWVASGQSNMGWRVQQSDNAKDEIAAANHPTIRFFRAALKTAPAPAEDLEGKWEVSTPETAGPFSAVGYFFARHLAKQLNTPVGILQNAWGGTPADSWISAPSLAADPALISVYADWAKSINDYPAAKARYDRALKRWEVNRTGPRPAPPIGPGHQYTPSTLFNSLIAPMTPYAIRGAIWYQGENNAGKKRSYVYRRLFPAMISDWRNAWGQGDFPFLYVQLANFGRKPGTEWPELREAQTMTLRLANTGMAVSIDIGNPDDIHPTNKQDVGTRLGLAARAIAYGEKLVYSGPLYRQAVPEAGGVRLFFDHAGSGLKAKGGELKGFEIAGADGKYVPASAKIDGVTIVVSSPEVSAPRHARYAWTESPECNLYNAEGLPASPFRTEEWKSPTEYR